ncbi:MAG: DUF3267 domain-containing protein [Ardenticatenaceae bacterium]|nr:DUF3267 domain-containing protein [Ardenticatenaceae bacterium]MCB9445543.1 DUF3267 domain-containing protein [Ardenticatenaceae bacterium]
MKEESTAEKEYTDATISFVWANGVAFLIIPAAVAIFVLPYWLLGGRMAFVGERPSPVILLLAFVGGIVVHELLHAVGFVVAGKVAVTAVKFGFSWKGLAPYAHCAEPMRASAYRLSIMLPGLVLGILPGILGVILLSWPLVLWGILMVIAAGGDLAVLLAIRQVPGMAWVRDHPTKAGCQVLMEDSDE